MPQLKSLLLRPRARRFVKAMPPTRWFSTSSQGKEAFNILYDGTRFVAVNLYDVGVSSDGASWTFYNNTFSGVSITGIRNFSYGNGVYLISGSISTVYNLLRSTDLVNWSPVYASVIGSATAAAYGNGLIVLLNSSSSYSVVTSTDGLTWTSRRGNTGRAWGGIVYANNLFVAVASAGSYSYSPVMTSPDGINWSDRDAPERNEWNDVTYGNGLYVAVASTGTNRVMYSTDGASWSPASAPGSYKWRSVTFNGAEFVAVADSSDSGSSDSATSRSMVSKDGVNWSLISTPSGGWRSVACGNNVLVAVGPSTYTFMRATF